MALMNQDVMDMSWFPKMVKVAFTQSLFLGLCLWCFASFAYLPDEPILEKRPAKIPCTLKPLYLELQAIPPEGTTTRSSPLSLGFIRWAFHPDTPLRLQLLEHVQHSSLRRHIASRLPGFSLEFLSVDLVFFEYIGHTGAHEVSWNTKDSPHYWEDTPSMLGMASHGAHPKLVISLTSTSPQDPDLGAAPL